MGMTEYLLIDPEMSRKSVDCIDEVTAPEKESFRKRGAGGVVSSIRVARVTILRLYNRLANETYVNLTGWMQSEIRLIVKKA